MQMLSARRPASAEMQSCNDTSLPLRRCRRHQSELNSRVTQQQTVCAPWTKQQQQKKRTGSLFSSLIFFLCCCCCCFMGGFPNWCTRPDRMFVTHLNTVQSKWRTHYSDYILLLYIWCSSIWCTHTPLEAPYWAACGMRWNLIPPSLPPRIIDLFFSWFRRPFYLQIAIKVDDFFPFLRKWERERERWVGGGGDVGSPAARVTLVVNRHEKVLLFISTCRRALCDFQLGGGRGEGGGKTTTTTMGISWLRSNT